MSDQRVWGVLLVFVCACGRTTPLPLPSGKVCRLVGPSYTLEFGDVLPGAIAKAQATATNKGDAPCHLSQAVLSSGAPEYFSVTALPTVLTIDPGTSFTAHAAFAPPLNATAPVDRSGSLALISDDPVAPQLEVPLHARVLLCHLSVAPAALDFGNVSLNTTRVNRVTLTNDGNVDCHVSGVALAQGTDAHFSLPAQPTLLTIAPGASASLQVSFTAGSSAPPHQRTGTLAFNVDDHLRSVVAVPLTAFISTVCTEAGQYIYTIDIAGAFARFDPKTLTSVELGRLRCPTTSTPFSMNLDQHAIAWVLYSDEHLYRVDTATVQCTDSGYVPGQQGFHTFGMGSVFDSAAGTDTLYLATEATAGRSSLGVLALPSLAVTRVASLNLGNAELAGTGDGQLWAFVPASASTTNRPLLARIDRNTGNALESYDLSAITSVGGYAIKFFGGSFFIFIGTDVWKVERSALDPSKAMPTRPPVRVLQNPGRNIVGAGVSTCAPVQ